MSRRSLYRLLALRVDLRDETAAAEVTPEALAAYAEAHGWPRATTTDVVHVHRRDAHSLDEIHVPIAATLAGYGAAVLRAIARLAEHEARSPLAVWADLVGLPSGEPASDLPDCRSGGSPSRGDRPEVLPPWPPETSATPGAAQGVLPGMVAPARERRRSVHRWGVIAREELPADPLAPGVPHEEQVERCRHCLALRRRANTGARLGAQLSYSQDGQEWSYRNPPCRMKD